MLHWNHNTKPKCLNMEVRILVALEALVDIVRPRPCLTLWTPLLSFTPKYLRSEPECPSANNAKPGHGSADFPTLMTSTHNNSHAPEDDPGTPLSNTASTRLVGALDNASAPRNLRMFLHYFCRTILHISPDILDASSCCQNAHETLPRLVCRHLIPLADLKTN